MNSVRWWCSVSPSQKRQQISVTSKCIAQIEISWATPQRRQHHQNSRSLCAGRSQHVHEGLLSRDTWVGNDCTHSEGFGRAGRGGTCPWSKSSPVGTPSNGAQIITEALEDVTRWSSGCCCGTWSSLWTCHQVEHANVREHLLGHQAPIWSYVLQIHQQIR